MKEIFTTENDILSREIDLLTNLYDKIQMGMDFERFLDEVLDTIRDSVTFDGCNVSLVDEERQLRIHRLSPSRISEKFKATPEYLEKRYEEVLSLDDCAYLECQAARTGEEIYLPEIFLDQYEGKQREIFENYGISGLYYLPITQGEKLYGVLRFHNYEKPMRLSELEKDLIRRRVRVLGRAFDNMKIYEELAAKNRIQKRDLELARRIQENFLPGKLPKYSGVDIAVRYYPMEEVGGDYYDFTYQRHEENKGFGILMTDASGHGVPAAFITSMVRIAFQRPFVARHADAPEMVLSEVNRALLNNIAGNFVTAVYAYFDLVKGELKASWAGHPAVFVLDRVREEVEQFEGRGKFLGVFEDPEFCEQVWAIKPGQRFFFYTDGLLEAVNAKEELFEDVFFKVLSETGMLKAEEAAQKIFQSLEKFTGNPVRRKLEDDIAYVIVDII